MNKRQLENTWGVISVLAVLVFAWAVFQIMGIVPLMAFPTK